MFTAIINTPGYMPETDPVDFGTAAEAWEYLLDERRDAEDDAIMAGLGTGDGYSETLNQIERAAEGDEDYVDPVGTGTIYGATPGYDGDHDLGVAYTVSNAIW